MVQRPSLNKPVPLKTSITVKLLGPEEDRIYNKVIWIVLQGKTGIEDVSKHTPGSSHFSSFHHTTKWARQMLLAYPANRTEKLLSLKPLSCTWQVRMGTQVSSLPCPLTFTSLRSLFSCYITAPVLKHIKHRVRDGHSVALNSLCLAYGIFVPH